MKAEIDALKGLPHFVHKWHKDRGGAISEELTGGICFDFILKEDGHARLGYRGNFDGRDRYYDSDEGFWKDGQDEAIKRVDSYLDWIEDSRFFPEKLGCLGQNMVVFDTDLTGIVMACCSSEFHSSTFSRLSVPFGMLLERMYGDRGEEMLHLSVEMCAQDGALDYDGAEVMFEEYWLNSPECIALREAWDALPEGEELGKFGNRLFDLS